MTFGAGSQIGPGVVPVRQPVHYEGPEAGGGGLIMEDVDKEVMTMVVWTSSHDGGTFLIIGDCEERYGEVDEFVVKSNGEVNHIFSESWYAFLRKYL